MADSAGAQISYDPRRVIAKLTERLAQELTNVATLEAALEAAYARITELEKPITPSK